MIFVDGERKKVFNPDGFSFESFAFVNTSGIYSHIYFQRFQPLSFSLDLMTFVECRTYGKVDDNSKYYLRYYIFLDSETDSLKLISSNFLELIPQNGFFQKGEIIDFRSLDYQVRAVCYNYISALKAILHSKSKTQSYRLCPLQKLPNWLR